METMGRCHLPGEVKIVEDNQVQVAVMVKSGPHYKWPAATDCIFYPLEDVVKKLKPPVVKTARGAFAFIAK